MEQKTRWMKLRDAGRMVEVLSFLALSALGLGLGLLLGFNSFLALLICTYGTPTVFWRVVNKLAAEDEAHIKSNNWS